MKKYMSIFLAGVLVAVFCSLSLAEEKKEGRIRQVMMQGGMSGQKGMMGEEGAMMGKGKMVVGCPVHGMMMKQMMDREVIAAADGGVIILAGNKLAKYDKELNLVKEVEIKADLAGMQKVMQEAKENCPMCKKMSDDCKAQAEKEKSAGGKTADAVSGHSAHH